MRTSIVVIALSLTCVAAACTKMPAAAPNQKSPAKLSASHTSPLEKPILKFEIIEVPGPGRVVAVSGSVVVFRPYGRIDVGLGLTLPLGSQLQISPGSSLEVQFEGGQSLRLAPSPVERALQFGLSSPTEQAS